MKIETRARVGAPVVLQGQEGDYAVPKAVTIIAHGERGAPDIRIECAMADGQPVVREVHIVATPEGRPVQYADLADLVVERLARRAFLDHGSLVEVVDAGAGSVSTSIPMDYARAQRDLASTFKKSQQRAELRERQAELRKVARVYKQHVAGAPVEAVATILGYTRRTASRRIKQAEEAGLLPATTAGRKRV